MVIEVGVVGAGFMGRTHVNSYSKIDDAEVSYICDIDESKGKPLAEESGSRYLADFEDLLAKEIDVVDICLPTRLHTEFAVKTLDKGFNLFLEKPLAINCEEGERIVNAADSSSGMSMIGHVVRFWPGYSELRESVIGEEIGRPRHVLSYRVGPSPGWADWYMDMKKSNGVIFDLGLHDIDFIRWMMGEPRSIFSQVFRRSGVHAHGQVVLDFGSAEALCECSWLGADSFPFTTYVEVAGTDGLTHIDSRENRAYSSFGEQEVSRMDPYHRDGYVRELRHFVECVKDDREPAVPLSEGLETVRVSLAAVRSADLGQPVEV